MNRDYTPALKWFASVSFVLAFLLAGFGPAAAAQASGVSSLMSSRKVPAHTQQLVQGSSPLRMAQATTRGTHGRVPPVTTPPPTSGGGKRPPVGGGKKPPGVVIDIGKLLPPPTTYRPKYPPQKAYRPPVKKVYKPRPQPRQTVRRTPPARPPVVAIQPIPQFIADQVTVLIRNQPQSVDNELAQVFGLTVVRSTPVALLDGRMVTFRLPAGRQLPQLIAELSADPRVDVAQPNNIYLTVQQHARAAAGSAQYALAKLGLGSAHRIAQGRGVPVAVIDTGVDVTHPDLAKTVGKSFNVVSDSAPDPDEHGTAIAGLIAGQGKVTGVAPAANLLAVRAFYMDKQYKRPLTSTDILVRAFDWAFTNGARVFNMSFTGPYDPLVQTALAAAHAKGVILVAAAGNGGPKAPPAYPAAYKNVIAITATDQQDRLYAQANRGGYLAAAAPGVNVLVPTLGKSYKFSSGTSMAAAHVSGMVALLLEKNPNATSADILGAIQATAQDLGPKGHDIQFGAGRANAHASLLSLSAGEVKLTSGQ